MMVKQKWVIPFLPPWRCRCDLSHSWERDHSLLVADL